MEKDPEKAEIMKLLVIIKYPMFQQYRENHELT